MEPQVKVIFRSEESLVPRPVPPNKALERAAKGCGWRAARVRRDSTLAARCNGLARPAQRGR